MIRTVGDSSALPAGVILAGGGSRRMGGSPKAFCRLAGNPLLQHVIDRVNPQVSDLYLSVGHFSESLATFGLQQLPDQNPGAGPLAGVLSSLQQIDPAHEWLFIAPCDAPFLPLDLVGELVEAAHSTSLPGAVVCYDSQLQPTFSIWNRSLRKALERALLSGGVTSFKQFLGMTQLAILDWPKTDPSPFFNINDRETLQQAGRWFEPDVRNSVTCSA